MTDYPKVYLAVDNCFASKRWTEPLEWMEIAKKTGVSYVEASADTECDPLYMGSNYVSRWQDKIRQASEKKGVRVANLYSGHGTYATLGLAHTDSEICERFLDKWLKPMCKVAGNLGAGLGFFCHAFSNSVLQDKDRYKQFEHELYSRLDELAAYASSTGCQGIGVEQMYTPHQIPWTINGSIKLLQNINRNSSKPFYITIDLGHQCGQKKFTRPDTERIQKALEGGFAKSNTIWLGTEAAWGTFTSAFSMDAKGKDAAIARIQQDMDEHKYLFCDTEDANSYTWLKKLGGYSPIIHLQQTDGNSSSHLPFTNEYNNWGIIKADKVLNALAAAFECENVPENLPQKCKKIYLTLEIFSSTADINRDIIARLEKSVSYWRKWIPEDGIPLNHLVAGVE